MGNGDRTKLNTTVNHTLAGDRASAEREAGWRTILAGSIRSVTALAHRFPLDTALLERVERRFPMCINPYYLSLIRQPQDPIWRQAVPDIRELDDDGFSPDPQRETANSPVPNLVHRYRDRVLMIVSDRCALYCRHCFRKRRVGRRNTVTPESLDRGIRYIELHREVKEVILSGGDPLLLENTELAVLLERLRAIASVAVLRIHSRVPCSLPQRVTEALAALLREYHPLYLNTQFNHPDEITPEAAAACIRLADAGIPLGCQSVLLKGVNDRPEIMVRLMRTLLSVRVKPYYLHHADPVCGTAHLRTSVACGLSIMRELQNRLPGMAVPRYMIDLPSGGGKIPMHPQYVETRRPNCPSIGNSRRGGRACPDGGDGPP
jgi:lysine 2,3-aminomutase